MEMYRYGWQGLVASILLLPAIGGAMPISLGAAANYNTVVFGNFEASGSDTEGRLAIGGNALLYDYSVGLLLDAHSLGSSLVIGGDLDLKQGRINYGNLYVAGDAQITQTAIDHGDVYVGNQLNFSNASIENGDLAVGGNLVFNQAEVKNGQVTSSGIITGDESAKNLSLQTPIVTPIQPTPFNFESESIYLKALANDLSQRPTNGISQLEFDTNLQLIGDGSSILQVFDLEGDKLLNATSIELDNVQSNAVVLINVNGEQSGFTEMGFNALMMAMSSRLLFNFYQATTLEITSVGVNGSILAPYAHINSNSGQINGTTIAASWNGNVQQNDVRFLVPVPSVISLFLVGLWLLWLTHRQPLLHTRIVLNG